MGLFTWIRRKRPQSQRERNTPLTQTNRQPALEGELYMLSKDVQEVNRLDFQHYLLHHAIKANYLAPLTHPAAILDVACGTGRWMQEMAEEFPQAQIMGIDLTPPHQGKNALIFPPNCHFQQWDVLKGLPFGTQQFEFTHQRLLILALPLQRWPSMVQELVRVTRPGGWIELVEADLNFHHQGAETSRLMQWIADASHQRGIDISIGQKIGSFLRDAKLTQCMEQKIALPIGNWGGAAWGLIGKRFFCCHPNVKATGDRLCRYFS